MKDTRFKPGQGGRPRGSKNKNKTRQELTTWIDQNFITFQAEMQKVKGKAFCELYIKVLPFIMPSYQSISFSLRNLSEDDLAYMIEKIKEQVTQSEDE